MAKRGRGAKPLRDDSGKAAEWGVFDKKSNDFKQASSSQVLPPPPREEQHVPRKLRAIMALRADPVAAGQKHKQQTARVAQPPAPQQQAQALPQRAVGASCAPTSALEVAGDGQAAKRKRKHESRKDRKRRARLEQGGEEEEEEERERKPVFGEQVQAPPEVMLKLKRSDLERLKHGDTGNRLSRLFEKQLSDARSDAQPPPPKRKKVDKAAVREAQQKERLRAELISKYRDMRRPPGFLAAALPPAVRPKV